MDNCIFCQKAERKGEFYVSIFVDMFSIRNCSRFAKCLVNKSKPERVYIPCFKVESDDNGKVKNITYPYGGTPVNKIEDNKNVLQKETEKVIKENNINVKNEAKKKSNKMKIIIPIIVVALIIICISIIVILKNRDNDNVNTNTNETTVEEQQETSAIEIGTKYNYVGNSVAGYIEFNSEIGYVMNMVYDMIERK